MSTTTPHPYRHPRHNIVARIVIPFKAEGKRQPPAEIFYFDFLLFKVLRIINTAGSKLTITDLTVNHEFQPGAMLTDWFYLFHYPVVLNQKGYLEAVLQMPSATGLPLDCSYPKLPAFLTLATNRDEFTFKAGKEICCENGAGPGVKQPLI